jgi:hypothetical protein
MGLTVQRSRTERQFSRRVLAKIEWHPGEFYPRIGFIVTNLARPAERVVVYDRSAAPWRIG